MKEYHEFLKTILDSGQWTENRTGVRTLSYFGLQMRFDLSEGFPAVTTKKLAWRPMVAELFWFLEGSRDERALAELTYGKKRTEIPNRRTIWTDNGEDAKVGVYNDNERDLGPVYGQQWRNFKTDNKFEPYPRNFTGYDQIKEVIRQLWEEPDSRRIIVSAWNPTMLKSMALPPCHVMFQFRVIGNKLSCHMTQRSADAFLGSPFNVASYALLTHILAREVGLEVGDLIISVGDAHIYENHMEQVEEQLSREPYPLPTLKIDDSFELEQGLNQGFWYNDPEKIFLENYQYHPTIKAKMAV